MKRKMTLLAGVVLASATMVAVPRVFADDQSTADKAGQKLDNAADKINNKIGDVDVKSENTTGLAAGQLPPGIQKSTKDDSEDIRQGLAKTAEGALDKKDLHELVENFVDADRNRLDPYVKQHKDDQAFANVVNQIRADWKAKYGQDFDIKHKIAFGPEFKGFMIAQGEIANPALLSDWPVLNKGEAQQGRQDQTNRKGNRPGDRNLEKGRNVAVVTFPESHGMPELYVSMIHEMPDRWRVDVPDNVDGQMLHDGLFRQLTSFEQKKDQWPADVNEGYRMFTHSVLMAIYDVNSTNAAQK